MSHHDFAFASALINILTTIRAASYKRRLKKAGAKASRRKTYKKGMGKVEITVLLKNVPSTESQMVIADDGVSLKLDDVKTVINPYDEYAVEEALKIKEKHGGSVAIVSMGDERSAEGVQTALAMGADRGLLIKDPLAAEYDSLKTAKILSELLMTMPDDLIVAGQRSVDRDNAQVGAAVAEFLDIPSISMVVEQEISDGVIRCSQSVESGTATLEAPLPILFTTQRGLNEPRYASLPGIMKAKRKPLEIKAPAELGIDPDACGESLVKTVRLFYPPERAGGEIVEGDSAEEKAAKLIEALHRKEGLF